MVVKTRFSADDHRDKVQRVHYNFWDISQRIGNFLHPESRQSEGGAPPTKRHRRGHWMDPFSAIITPFSHE